ncbi:hypothetical protein E2C01_084970 [Portunus trituberculatus]|uniref:Uncharacterized protein n=1 Tax=Portunus trituberculatus TaxID=210409 RepID=A0A5B7JCA9_PORTR|nr:hypothetical protein [Portunus trituberculatus]
MDGKWKGLFLIILLPTGEKEQVTTLTSSLELGPPRDAEQGCTGLHLDLTAGLTCNHLFRTGFFSPQFFIGFRSGQLMQ